MTLTLKGQGPSQNIWPNKFLDLKDIDVDTKIVILSGLVQKELHLHQCELCIYDEFLQLARSYF